mgnify:CR=1 FL=1
MNKLRRNNSHFRFTVEDMGYDPCGTNCEDFCFMISCICDNLNPTQNEHTYQDNHERGAIEGTREMTRIYGY